MNNNFTDRILSVLFYWTMGFLGIIYLIFAYMNRKTISAFNLFNIYQSLFISILLYILSFVYRIFINLITVIPIIGKFVISADSFLFKLSFVFGCSAVTFLLIVFLLYLSIFCLLGKRPQVPFVSQIVSENFGG